MPTTQASVRFWLQMACFSMVICALDALSDGIRSDGPWWWQAWAFVAVVPFSIGAVKVFRYQATLTRVTNR